MSGNCQGQSKKECSLAKVVKRLSEGICLRTLSNKLFFMAGNQYDRNKLRIEDCQIGVR